MTYVDNMAARYGRLIMSHLLADSTDELLAMAARLGLQPRWLQHAGTPREHFDISLSKRTLAVRYGAQEITWKDAGRLVAQKREALMAECEICHRGIMEGVTLWRMNETGVDGIWRCTAHRTSAVDALLEEVVTDIEAVLKEPQSPPVPTQRGST